MNRAGSLTTVFFTDRKVRNWDDAAIFDTKAFGDYFATMTNQGFLIAPSQFEAIFLSNAHTETEIAAFSQAADTAFARLSR